MTGAPRRTSIGLLLALVGILNLFGAAGMLLEGLAGGAMTAAGAVATEVVPGLRGSSDRGRADRAEARSTSRLGLFFALGLAGVAQIVAAVVLASGRGSSFALTVMGAGVLVEVWDAAVTGFGAFQLFGIVVGALAARHVWRRVRSPVSGVAPPVVAEAPSP